jgi:polyphosphate kinase
MRTVALPHRQVSRVLAQLAFNHRMLALAEEPACPLLEGLRFLCRVSANLDRLFETTMARLMAAAECASTRFDDEPGASNALATVVQAAHDLTTAQYRLLNARLLPALQEQGVRFLRRTEFTRRQSDWVRRYFFREIRPVLTPIGLDPAHPFPRVLNKSLNFAVELHGKDAFGRHSTIAIVQAPRVLPRVVRVPREIAETEYGFVFLSSLLHAQIDVLFPATRGRCTAMRGTLPPMPGSPTSRPAMTSAQRCGSK